MVILHDPRCAHYRAPGHPERPERVIDSAEHLRRAHPDWSWQIPVTASEEAILRAHSSIHLASLQREQAFDPDTPAHAGIEAHARRAAGAAIACAQLALAGQRAFSLMRPPGHHATRAQAMGFCYLNSVAITALDARARGVNQVAIWDFDAHHGNGTEAICDGIDGLRYVSMHQHPAYPGTGTRSRDNLFNFPVSPETTGTHQMAVLRQTWDCVLDFKPELILVSAGFDAYVEDPLVSLSLTREDFGTLGLWLAQTQIPVAAILEGGYSPDLPLLIDAFLSAWDRSD